MAKKAAETITITLPEIKHYVVTITGITPLLVHAWSPKAKRMMREAQEGTKKAKKREARRPFSDFVEATYWISGKPEDPGDDDGLREAFYRACENGARFGFSASAIKQSANAAAYRKGFVKNQMGLRGAWFIPGEGPEQLVEIKTDKPPVKREDPVTVGIGGTDLRYRPEFENWSIDIPIELDITSGFDINFIAAALAHAGRSVGIGEWRVENDGVHGMFEVTKVVALD